MRIMIAGTDITGRYPWQDVETDDTDGSSLDVCMLTAAGDLASSELAQAGQDTLMEVSEEGYTTGKMYVDAVTAKDGETTMFARGTPAKGREKGWAAYENVTLMELVHIAALELNMGYQQFGITDRKYGRMIRRDETQAEFLRRVLRMEGAVLKVTGGKLTAVDIAWAQQQSAVHAFEITASTPGCLYKEEYAGYRTCTVSGMGIDGTATDTQVPGSRTLRPREITPENSTQAKRWAMGELLHKNRMSSVLMIDLDFDPKIAAMSRMDITGMKATEGAWIANRVTQNMILRKTRVYLRRCITTIV